MRICIWFRTTKSAWGGSNTFLRTLSQQLERSGHEVIQWPSYDVDLVLLNSWSAGPGRRTRLGQIEEVRRTGRASVLGRVLPLIFWNLIAKKGPPIVHRADGIAHLYGRKDTSVDSLQFEITQLADYVVFQSEYSKDIFAQFGVRPRYWSVIYNGVDGDIFYPATRSSYPHNPLRVAAVSWSQNPMKGFEWLPRLADLPNVEVRFIGRWCPSVSPGNVQLLGVKTSEQLADILRDSDALVQPARNEACSNVILEGLACGLPVIYCDSGGNKELAGDFGISLHDNLPQLIDELKERYSELRSKVLSARPQFLIQHSAAQYVRVFKQVLSTR